ncbi:MAG: transcription elongation factor GreA [Clostridia bacterium]|nr:transcription elongation factor GreA [Clostridia bacterium]
MMAEVFLTKEAYKELEEKLAYLKNQGRVDVAEKIKVARSFGDISENSEYDAAREEEALLEQEISQIEEDLKVAQIIDNKKVNKDVISVGAEVDVYDRVYKEDLTFKIMGSFESDPTKGLISNESPIGKALIGQKVGVTVEVKTPMETLVFEVKAIRY